MAYKASWTMSFYGNNQLLMKEFSVSCPDPTSEVGSGGVSGIKYIINSTEREIWILLIDTMDKIVVLMKYYDNNGKILKTIILHDCSFYLKYPLEPSFARIRFLLDYERAELI